MGRHQPVARTYRPPRRVDWGKSVHRRRYMMRELTSVFLIAYALVLLFGLWRLSQGEAAFEAWRSALGHPLAIFGHALVFVAALYHTRSWFEVMPRTLPDSGLKPERITRAGWTAAAVASLLVLTFVVVGGM
ncbi:MAG: fumarate reductase subunit C [Burkholderiaceae bacterium]|nr:fumarate reductase subunit C [Burkholderiaceae bacterium]